MARRTSSTAGSAAPTAAAEGAGAIAPARPGGARMEDVAREAGVSLVTVSRAVNQPDKLAPATLAVVRAAIDRLGFVPNLTAGSLASRRSRIAAAIVPTLASSIFSDTIDGLSQALAESGYQLLVGQTHFRVEEEAGLIAAFVGRRVDGMVVIRAGASAANDERLRRAGVPVVEAWDLAAAPIDMEVGFSNVDAGAAAADHLLARGHRRLAFIGSTGGRASLRLAGMRRALAAVADASVVVQPVTANATLAEAAEAFAAVRVADPAVTAIFCANDMLAAGVLFECRRAGIDVPRQLAVMGFADSPIAAAIEPPLSTVHVPSREIGERAGRMLLARLRGEPIASVRVDVGFRVIARASV